MRRCVGCMTSFPKSEVLRFVALDGKIVIDRTGKLNGRGTYICRSMDCFDAAIKKKRLSFATKISLKQEEVDILREEYAKEISNAEVCE